MESPHDIQNYTSPRKDIPNSPLQIYGTPLASSSWGDLPSAREVTPRVQPKKKSKGKNKRFNFDSTKPEDYNYYYTSEEKEYHDIGSELLPIYYAMLKNLHNWKALPRQHKNYFTPENEIEVGYLYKIYAMWLANTLPEVENLDNQIKASRLVNYLDYLREVLSGKEDLRSVFLYYYYCLMQIYDTGDFPEVLSENEQIIPQSLAIVVSDGVTMHFYAKDGEEKEIPLNRDLIVRAVNENMITPLLGQFLFFLRATVPEFSVPYIRKRGNITLLLDDNDLFEGDNPNVQAAMYRGPKKTKFQPTSSRPLSRNDAKIFVDWAYDAMQYKIQNPIDERDYSQHVYVTDYEKLSPVSWVVMFSVKADSDDRILHRYFSGLVMGFIYAGQAELETENFITEDNYQNWYSRILSTNFGESREVIIRPDENAREPTEETRVMGDAQLLYYYEEGILLRIMRYAGKIFKMTRKSLHFENQSYNGYSFENMYKELPYIPDEQALFYNVEQFYGPDVYETYAFVLSHPALPMSYSAWKRTTTARLTYVGHYLPYEDHVPNDMLAQFLPPYTSAFESYWNIVIGIDQDPWPQNNYKKWTLASFNSVPMIEYFAADFPRASFVYQSEYYSWARSVIGTNTDPVKMMWDLFKNPKDRLIVGNYYDIDLNSSFETIAEEVCENYDSNFGQVVMDQSEYIKAVYFNVLYALGRVRSDDFVEKDIYEQFISNLKQRYNYRKTTKKNVKGKYLL